MKVVEMSEATGGPEPKRNIRVWGVGGRRQRCQEDEDCCAPGQRQKATKNGSPLSAENRSIQQGPHFMVGAAGQ